MMVNRMPREVREPVIDIKMILYLIDKIQILEQKLKQYRE